MYFHVQQLINEIDQDQPDPDAANALQEGLGGQFGEMRTMMQYLFQSINFRGPSAKPYKDLIQGIGTGDPGPRRVEHRHDGAGDPTTGRRPQGGRGRKRPSRRLRPSRGAHRGHRAAPHRSASQRAFGARGSRRRAALRYRGRWTESAYEEHLARLRAALAAEGFSATGDPRFARFDPPLWPAFLRHNEVLLDVEPFTQRHPDGDTGAES